MTVLPYLINMKALPTMSRFAKGAIALCLNSALSLGLRIIASLQATGHGLKWSTMTTRTSSLELNMLEVNIEKQKQGKILHLDLVHSPPALGRLRSNRLVRKRSLSWRGRGLRESVVLY